MDPGEANLALLMVIDSPELRLLALQHSFWCACQEGTPVGSDKSS